MATLIASPIPEPRIDWRDLDGTRKRINAWAEAIADHADRASRDPDHMVGRIVKFQIADGYAEYVIYSVKPLQLVHVPESYDISAAHMRGLKLADVRALVDFDKRWEAMFDAHEDYFANLPVGTIVHYDNGFAQFVRCVRVEGPKGKRLRPIGMIGNWHFFDLPQRRPDGTVTLGYQAEKIAEGDCFEPNYGSIWERYDAERREYSMRGLANTDHLNEIGKARFAELPHQAPFDPTTEPLIDLTPPGLDGDQRAIAAYVKRMQAIAAALILDPQSLDEAREAYAAVRSLVVPDYELPTE